MEWVLALDSSSGLAYAVLSERSSGKQQVFESPRENSHSESLSGALQRFLEVAGITAQSLQLILLGQGPGSFTGLRIGFSLVQGLALGAGVPALTFSSFAAAAAAYSAAAPLRVVLSDARREEFFYSAYFWQPGELSEISAPRICRAADLQKEIGAAASGSGVTLDQTVVLCAPGTAIPPLPEVRHAAFSNLALGGLKLFELKPHHGSTDRSEAGAALKLAQLAPLYIRAAAARKISERVSNRSADRAF